MIFKIKNNLRSIKKEIYRIMNLFPFDNIVIGTIIFIVGFLFHFIGQLISVINWEYAKKVGLQEKKNLPEI